MYPHEELTRLERHKTALLRSIAIRRVNCTTAAARVTEPFAWLDQALGVWRQFAPIARVVALPLGLIAGRTLTPRFKILQTLLRWAPLAFTAARALTAAGKSSAQRR